MAIVGDSLTTGAGIGAERAYPNVIQQLAVNERWPIRINVYAGNGDTTADAWGRIREVVEGRPDVIVIALGGNDGLRGVPPAQMEANLRRIVIVALGIGAEVVLAGMEAPPNASTEYRLAFRAAFSGLARGLPVLFMPFLLEGVALNPALNQADGIHPNAIRRDTDWAPAVALCDGRRDARRRKHGGPLGTKPRARKDGTKTGSRRPEQHWPRR